MKIVDCAQGSPEWHAARLGKVGASRVSDVVARTKSGYSTSRANLAASLIAERLTGTTQDAYTNAAMAWGTATEPQARAMYEFMRDVDVAQVGLVLHPSIDMTHASPDGLVGDVGLVEIKCPNTGTHIDTLLGASIDGKYVKQMQWQMACTGRDWCDFVSFDPRMPEDMQLYIQRIERDEVLIAELEKEVANFLSEIDETIAKLTAKYRPTAIAAE